jgi:hypothetical protein
VKARSGGRVCHLLVVEEFDSGDGLVAAGAVSADSEPSGGDRTVRAVGCRGGPGGLVELVAPLARGADVHVGRWRRRRGGRLAVGVAAMPVSDAAGARAVDAAAG